MPESIREQVVQAFADRIGAARAERIDSESDLPVRALWDPTETTEKNKYGKYDCTVTVQVAELAARDFSVNSSIQGNDMLSRLLDDALTTDHTLGGLCKGISYTGSTLDFPAEGQKEMIVLVTFEVVYVVNNSNPYQQ